MPQTVVQLPAAHPKTYLRCVAFQRELEAALHELPKVASFAASQGAVFFRDEVADFISGVLVTSIAHQAATAARLRAPCIAPLLVGPADLMARAAELVGRRAAWLTECDAVEALGVTKLDTVAEDLRRTMIAAFRRQAPSLAPA
jgi:hypothetical protein